MTGNIKASSMRSLPDCYKWSSFSYGISGSLVYKSRRWDRRIVRSDTKQNYA